MLNTPCVLLFSGALAASPLMRLPDEGPSIKASLERDLISAEQTQSEVQAYVESRLPPMPMPESTEQWQEYAHRLRREVLDRVVFRGAAAKWRDATTRVEWLDSIEGGPGYRIRKLRYEALPGLWIPALLYEPEVLQGKVPVVLNVNGHDGNGKAARYKQIRCINQAKRGMIALNPEWLGMGQLAAEGYRHGRMNQLDLCGTSGLAPFYLAMSRGIDLLFAHEHADTKRVAVAGLSGGGWQTIIISSLDPRVRLCNPVAGYSSFRTRVRHFSDLGDSEQTPCDLATVGDYEHLTAILAPRPALLTYNVKDECCFAADHALPPLIDAARPVYRLFGKELSLRWHVNHHPGTHNFEKENREALYRMFGDYFFPDQKNYDSQEIACDNEVKTKEQLHVELPEANESFHTLALKLAQEFARHREQAKGGAEQQAQARRQKLAEIVRARTLRVSAELVATEHHDDVTCKSWRLALGDLWTIPAVEFTRGKPKRTVLLVADEGRQAALREIESLLKEDDIRVLALDLFYFGECKMPNRGYLFALLIATVGDRSLGIQSSQLAAVAQWAGASSGNVTIASVGPRSSVIALVAANLNPDAIHRVELNAAAWKLSDVITKNYSFEQAPELFCFGLLQEFDSDQLIELFGRDRVREIEPGE